MNRAKYDCINCKLHRKIKCYWDVNFFGIEYKFHSINKLSLFNEILI